MSFSKQFEKKLDKLFRQRTRWFRTILGSRKQGKPPEFDRRKVNAAIKKLQSLALKALSSKYLRAELKQHARQKRSWHVKGYGIDDKKNRFEKWFRKSIQAKRGCIYIFWGKHKKCIYIGRTGSGGKRPSAHFQKYWFSKVTRITIFPISPRSQIPKLECIAIHRFQPIRNKYKASTKKWTKKCPLCKITRHIRRELRSIFRFR